MRKRGYIINWQNRYWASRTTALGQGNADPNIPSGGKGDMPNFWVIDYKGRGWYYYYNDDDEKIEFLSDVAYISSPFKYKDETIYRFIVNYHRELPDANITEVFGFADCDSSGRFKSAVSSYESLWRSEIGSANRAYVAYGLYNRTLDNSYWSTILTTKPFISQNTYNMMMSDPDRIRQLALNASISGSQTGSTFAFRMVPGIWGESAFYWQSPSTSQSEIVNRARSLSGYKYWYGGAGQIATEALARSLRASYPGIWTESYFNKALKDIGQRVGDCSYLVNYAYGIASPGNHGIGTSQYLAKYSRWNGAPLNGMILWRSGHTGIYTNGKSIELVGIDYDYMERDYVANKWSAVLYDPNRSY